MSGEAGNSAAPPVQPPPARRFPAAFAGLPGGESLSITLWGAAAVLGSALIYTLVAFPAGLGVPVIWESDGLSVYMLAENFHRHGPIPELPDLAYPFGSTTLELPLVPNYVFILSLWISTFLTGGDVVAAGNLATIIVVAINALASYACLRVITRNSAVSAIASLIFALTYFAFIRSVVHTVVLSYSTVPLTCLAIYLAGVSRAPFRWSRLAAILPVCFLAGMSNAYHIIFAVLVFGGAGIAQALFDRRFAAVGRIFACGCVIAVMAVLLGLPSVLYRMEHGINPAISLVSTTSGTAELNAMRLSQLITYPGKSPIFGFQSFYDWLAKDRPPTETWSNYSGALVVIAGISVAYLMWTWRSLGEDRRRTAGFAAIGAVLAVAMFVPGGLGDVLIYFVQQLRALNRGVIILHFLAMLVFALALLRLAEWKPGNRSIGRMVAIGCAVLALGAAALDQFHAPDRGLVESATNASKADRKFFRQVRGELGQGEADLMQLPYQTYPEFGGPNGMRVNDQLMPYFMVAGSRTSAASYPGSPGSYLSVGIQDLFRAGRFGDMMSEAKASGFEGVTFDRRGLYGFETSRLDQLIGTAKGAIQGGNENRFIFMPVQTLANASDAVASGKMLASYGPISFGLDAGEIVHPKEGGAEAALGQSTLIRINRFEPKPMKTVLQFQIRCSAPNSLVAQLGQEPPSTFPINAQWFEINFAVTLPEPQASLQLSFAQASQGCMMRRPGVTFYE